MDLKGRVAIVTGGGKGIGKAISRRFARAGANLVLVARTKEPLEEMAEEAKQLGCKAIIVVGDASREETAEEAVNQAIAAFGKIDILVNNTGIEGPNAYIEDISLEDWNESMGVNLTSAFLFCKKVMPFMKKQKKGSIISISSLAGTRGIRCRTPYCASKWAMVGMNRAIAEEAGADNIRANIVCPGAINGERMERVLHKRAANYGVTYEEIVKKTTTDTPLLRFIEEDEIASAVLFLASDDASGITGEEIIVSGGRR